MGWGGSALAANQIIKNNRAMLKKRTKNKLSFASENKKWVDHKRASPELLKEIRLKLQREKRKEWKLTLLYFIGAIFLIYLLVQKIDFRYFWDNFR